jgi:hypothetical protein
VLAIAVAAVLALAGATVEGQAPANARAGAAAKWTVPRTPDGRPDMQGVWMNNSVTPLERPRQWENKQFLTDAELEELKKATAEVTHFWLVEREVEDRRTSLLTDPPNGKLPDLTQAARDRMAAAAAYRKEHPQDNPEDRGLGERCVNFGVPKLGAGYNNYYQIVQTPGHVMFLSEMAHDARIIPVDGRPHVNKNLKLWNGDPRGRWEGDTLVVESTNFSPKSEFRAARENLHLVEKYTRVGPDTLNYEITVTDPTTWTKPWTALIPLKRTDDPIYEYACHEGNYRSMEGSLKGTRTLEKEAAEATKTGTKP